MVAEKGPGVKIDTWSALYAEYAILMLMKPYRPLTHTKLDAIADALAVGGPWPGYPLQRMYIDTPGFVAQSSSLFVPEGPWHIHGHANREMARLELLDKEIPTVQAIASATQQAHWAKVGFLADQYGRPVHPYWKQLLTDRRIGLPTGIGMFYRYGPNRSVDSVVYTYTNSNEPTFLLVRQAATGKWGLPGGFVDASDGSLENAARREIAEETGLADLKGVAEVIIQALPMRRRDTLHAWSETVVFVIHADQRYLRTAPLQAGDDADAVGWFTEQEMAQLAMQDTHPPYITYARQFLRLQH
jgi:ADP-ribose pyrophosphatase YjhB (NUDIX family)